MSKVLIGYVNNFTHTAEAVKHILSGEPKEGSIYRIIFDEESKDGDKTYQLYIGRDSNEAQMDTIFLGNELKGNYHNKWIFDISEVTKENYLEFNFKEDELPKLKQWLDSDNEDLKELMAKVPTPIDVDNVSDRVNPTIATALKKVTEVQGAIDKSLIRMGKSLNVIVEKDIQLAFVLSDILHYIASTYKDKYEASGKANLAKDFLVDSESSDVAVFNTFKYLQRYSTKGFAKSGKTVDVYKAIHYLFFELQRVKNKTQDDKQA